MAITQGRYKEEYAEQLLGHLAKGYTFKSFGAIAHVSKESLYNWRDKYPEFALAKSIGECHRERFMMEMGHRISTGNLTRLESEETMLDAAGRVIMDANGKPAMRRHYVATKGNAATWIFSMRNMCGFTNRDVVEVHTKELTPDSLSPEDLDKEISQLLVVQQKRDPAPALPPGKRKRGRPRKT